ncbi:hypothetical protein QNH20_12325 [Neobacillus sp. WH10]|uniref:DUF6882 domain-containing protein n=1 Tax=Neobacillus sp. WH10 TaxID=3047873 RepID=UPI0024C10D9B|nr:DUF6882 domain-containing protein [Neobacillus sp. WH10]WHY79877.1 hypothetical protein QNH20_12325 [Neobacillus sp. WH10]
MSMTDDQFDDYLDYCYDKLESKQGKLFQKYGIGSFEEYWYSQEGSILQFKTDSEVKLEFNVVFIGSWSSNSDTWMWAWGNESMIHQTRNQSIVLKELQQVTGYDIFANPYFKCDEAMAHELTAFAVEHLNAEGMYISPDGKSHLFMAIMSQNFSKL